MEKEEQVRIQLFNGIGAIKLAKVQLENLVSSVKDTSKQDDVRKSVAQILRVLLNVDQSLIPLSDLDLLPVAARALSEKGERMCEVVKNERYALSAIRSCCNALINHMEYIINDLERIRSHYYA